MMSRLIHICKSRRGCERVFGSLRKAVLDCEKETTHVSNSDNVTESSTSVISRQPDDYMGMYVDILRAEHDEKMAKIHAKFKGTPDLQLELANADKEFDDEIIMASTPEGVKSAIERDYTSFLELMNDIRILDNGKESIEKVLAVKSAELECRRDKLALLRYELARITDDKILL